jgi:glycerate kinase
LKNLDWAHGKDIIDLPRGGQGGGIGRSLHTLVFALIGNITDSSGNFGASQILKTEE